jgi:beta-lactam-binding protein with PASTA domain
VSNGVAPIVTLPDVVGSSADTARSALGYVHVFVNVVEQTVVKPKNDGIVLSMDPAGGSRVKEGTSVTLVVGVLAPSSSPSPPGKGKGHGNGKGGGGGGH